MIGKIWDVAAKDLRLVARDRTALVMMFAVPLLLIALLGSVISSSFGGGNQVKADVSLINQDSGQSARSLVKTLKHDPALNITVRTDQNAAEKSVRNGDLDGLVIIPRGFSAAVQSQHPARFTFYTVSNNTSASAQVARFTVQNLAQRFASQSEIAQVVTRVQRIATGRTDPAIAVALASQAGKRLENSPPVSVNTINATGRKINGVDNTVPGYALMFALFALTAGAGTVLEEKEEGTFKRLLIAPLPPLALLGGKLLAQFLQTIVQMTVLFVAGALIFKIDLGSSIPALALLIVGTSFAATGLGMILISFIKSQRQLRPITSLIVLSFSALGGSWWPLSIEPQWMQTAAKVTLNSWAMQGFNGLMIFDKSFTEVLPYIGALFIYGLICFSIARRTFRFVEA